MPSESEVAQEIKLSVRQARTFLGQVARSRSGCLDAPAVSGGAQSIGELLRDPGLGPEALVEAGEWVAAVGRAIKTLRKRERFVILASYVEERRLADIGVELGVSEARVSQIRSEALAKLRRNLRMLDPAS